MHKFSIFGRDLSVWLTDQQLLIEQNQTFLIGAEIIAPLRLPMADFANGTDRYFCWGRRSANANSMIITNN
jgi:hypothetical protein